MRASAIGYATAEAKKLLSWTRSGSCVIRTSTCGSTPQKAGRRRGETTRTTPAERVSRSITEHREETQPRGRSSNFDMGQCAKTQISIRDADLGNTGGSLGQSPLSDYRSETPLQTFSHDSEGEVRGRFANSLARCRRLPPETAGA